MAHQRLIAAIAVLSCAAGGGVAMAQSHPAKHGRHVRRPATAATRTPIRHIVVIYQENVSFDHYFGTYPHAANTDGHHFKAKRGTPAVDGLRPTTASSLPKRLRHTTNLLKQNPNTALPARLGANGQLTCDQDH